MDAKVVRPVGRAVEKPIDFWLRKGKAVGETKPTEKEVALQNLCNPIAEREWQTNI